MIATATRPTALMTRHESRENPHTSTSTHNVNNRKLITQDSTNLHKYVIEAPTDDHDKRLDQIQINTHTWSTSVIKPETPEMTGAGYSNARSPSYVADWIGHGPVTPIREDRPNPGPNPFMNHPTVERGDAAPAI